MKNSTLKNGCELNRRYEVKRTLGQGGFGITYAAFDRNLNQNVVIKEYFPVFMVSRREDGKNVEIQDQDAMELCQKGKKRFLKEAQILASLFEIPGVVKVLDFFEENQTAYIVMEYVHGISLRSYLERSQEEITFVRACEMLLPVMEALEKIHKKGLLHRDINPDNLMVEENGNVRMLDFGSAREFFLEQDREKTMTVLVKNGYAPPEQYEKKGKQGPWTDIYALCATMYEMMTGCMPPDGKERQIKDELYPPSSFDVQISAEQEAIFLGRGLALDPGNRYHSIRELREDFLPIRQEKSQGTSKKTWKTAVTAAVILLILAAILGYVQRQKIQNAQAMVYAGNYDRDSQEYEDFMKFLREHAESIEQISLESGDKATEYTLQRESIEELGIPSNAFTLEMTIEEIKSRLESDGYTLLLSDTQENMKVVEEPYGVLKSSFAVTETYKTLDGVVLRISFDCINKRIMQIFIFAEKGTNGDYVPLLLDLLYEINPYIKEENMISKETLYQDQQVFLEEKQEGKETLFAYDGKNMLIQYAEVSDEEAQIGMLIYPSQEIYIIPPYNW